MTSPPVSVVIPVHNGRHTLPAVLRAIARECAGRPFEIIAVDDGSVDGSSRYLRGLEVSGRVRLLKSAGRGIAAAINTGIREARYPFIAQVDQDVIVQQGWLDTLLVALEDPDVAAAQGHFVTADGAGIWARVMGRDLELRYARIRGSDVDQVCTGNTIYRSSALHRVGLFDESLGYGCDNDLSYRLGQNGQRLVFCRDAVSVHLWREDARGYLRQQLGVGYGRLDLIAKHPRRAAGDTVSGAGMILHGPLLLVAGLLALASFAAWLLDSSAKPLAAAAGLTVVALAVERFAAGISAWRRTGDRAALAFPAAHLLRDAAWAAAIIIWTMRWIAGVPRAPEHSMPRGSRQCRPGAGRDGISSFRLKGRKRADPHAGGTSPPHRAVRREVRAWLASHRVLVLIPAFNERANLERVTREIRRAAPDVDIVVVNDGSTDATDELLPRLGVGWLTLPHRIGIGGAVRTGLRFSLQRGYEHVIRMDGDGQHRARDIARLLAPVATGHADVVVGSRYAGRRGLSTRSVSKTALSVALSILTRRRVTDATSGCWVFGPRAVRLLARSHPMGYPEPELLLLLHRHGFRVEEVPVLARRRHSGRTTLTWFRAAEALARTVLAMVMVRARRLEQEGGTRGD